MSYVAFPFDPATMKGQDFTTATAIDRSVFSNVFGAPSQYWFSGKPNGLMIASTQAAGWPQVGFMQVDNTPGAGFGYGRYVWSFRSGQAGQGPGTNLIMWPANGQWFPSSIKGQATEIDVEEDWSEKGAPIATLHYDSSPVTAMVFKNGQEMHGIHFAANQNDTSFHFYEFDWYPDHIELWVDGVSQFRDTGPIVPKAFVDGGINRTLGAQVVIQTTLEPLPTIQMFLRAVYFVPLAVLEGGGGVVAPAPVPVPNPIPLPAPAPDPTPVPAPTPIPVPPTAPPPTAPAGSITVQVDLTASAVNYTVVKATGSAATLRLSFDGKYVGTIRDAAPDGTIPYHMPLPAPGAHAGQFYVDGSTVRGPFTFTVPATPSAPIPVLPNAEPPADASFLSQLTSALSTAPTTALAAVKKLLGIAP